jgi:hypothetical protein
VASRLQRAGVGTAVMSSSGVGSHAPLVAPWVSVFFVVVVASWVCRFGTFGHGGLKTNGLNLGLGLWLSVSHDLDQLCHGCLVRERS